jgi:hypothetical protein
MNGHLIGQTREQKLESFAKKNMVINQQNIQNAPLACSDPIQAPTS